MKEEVVQALTFTYAGMGQPLSDAAIELMMQDLADYDEADVLLALRSCRKGLRRIAFVDILDRLPGGHPGPEQAWALIACAMNDERQSLIWTDEMREAYRVALGVRDDAVACRMTFKEVYQQEVRQARETKRRITWTLSKGTDKALLEQVILEGVKDGKLTAAYAQRQLPHLPLSELEALRILQAVSPRLLGEPTPRG